VTTTSNDTRKRAARKLRAEEALRKRVQPAVTAPPCFCSCSCLHLCCCSANTPEVFKLLSALPACLFASQPACGLPDCPLHTACLRLVCGPTLPQVSSSPNCHLPACLVHACCLLPCSFAVRCRSCCWFAQLPAACLPACLTYAPCLLSNVCSAAAVPCRTCRW
jgi:hypothetical protein